MIFRRPYADAIRRQLDLFQRENGELLDRATFALRAYDESPRDEAEERYGDYADLLDLAAALLAEIRDAFAETVADPDGYRRAFDRAAARRFPELAEALKET
jgi:hypothetical protein